MGYPDHENLDATKEKRSPRRTWRITLFGLLVLAAVYFRLKPPLEEWSSVNGRNVGSACAQPSPAARRSNYSSVYDTPEFKQRSAERLSGAVKIPTMYVRLVRLGLE